jgi:pSer/pThr/pTyr-binding forkhead associated (FHA) protein
MLTLLCINGIIRGDEINLDSLHKSEILLGRSNDNDIQVIDSEASREHCKLTFKNNSIFIEDLGSRNGFFINEHFCKSKKELNLNDLIRIGKTCYLLYDTNKPPKNLTGIKTFLENSSNQDLANISEFQATQTLLDINIDLDKIKRQNES